MFKFLDCKGRVHEPDYGNNSRLKKITIVGFVCFKLYDDIIESVTNFHMFTKF